MENFIKVIFVALPAAIFFSILLLGLLRLSDLRADRTEIARLRTLQPSDPPRFSAAMVEDLPTAARRYFRYAIDEGTPLWTVAKIEMSGQIGMGQRGDPRYADMSAEQIIAAPHGFVWQANTGWLSGSDSGDWTRFSFAGLLPVVRTGGTDDHRRSAFGRLVAEALFWTPAALLPGSDVEWLGVDDMTAQVTVNQGDHSQTIDLQVNFVGQPVAVRMERWSNVNPDRTYRPQPFGGYLSEFRRFGGFTIPTRIEAGNFFGTPDYFPFFMAEVKGLTFPR
ncbi:MAG: DUF6544 family protein [Pseudomonadota bacterium]